jgi:transcriptional regulator with XRE-family HTH domain
MQRRFHEWLEEKLQERDWLAADLARASREPDYPRGFDPGLISRWRRPPPEGVVPNQAKTLTRLARAFGISESEVYAAAGLLPPDQADQAASVVQTELEARLARLGATLSKYPRAVWLAVLEANERMADALAHNAEPPVSAPEKGRVSAPIQEQTRGKPNDHEGFTLRKRVLQPSHA